MSDNKLNYKINTIPSLTWNWLKMNSDTISSDAVSADFSECRPKVNKVPDGITIDETEIPVSGTEMTDDATISGIFNVANKKMPDSRVDDEKTEAEQKSQNQVIHPLKKALPEVKGQTIRITGKTNEALILNFSGSDTAPSKNTLSAQTIVAEKDSEATVIFVYEDESPASTQIISTKIIARENAKLHIVKVQLLENSVLQLDDTAFTAEDNAKLQFTQIELGGKHVDSGLHVNLNGYKSSFKSNVAYICKNDQ